MVTRAQGSPHPLGCGSPAARLQWGSQGSWRAGVWASSPLLQPPTSETAGLGNQGCSSSRIGWASRSSALSFAVPLRSKTNRKGKKN